tara:strand:+ start:710 stop:1348 length:639 start_codon:yes stop_codon:yes gene_type:complete
MRVPINRTTGREDNRREYDPLYDPIYESIRTLIGFTQGLFRALPDKRYTWSPDPETTEITITGAYPLKAEMLNSRPAIVIGHTQSAYLNTSMNSLEKINPNTGNMVHRDLISSSAVFNCIARTGPEATALAWFVSSNIKALRGFLQRKGNFTRIGHDVTIGGESPPGSLIQDAIDGGAINSQVIIPFFIPHRWEVLSPAHQIDDITLTTKNN